MTGMQMVPWRNPAELGAAYFGDYSRQWTDEQIAPQVRRQLAEYERKVIEREDGDQWVDITSRSEIVLSRLSAVNVVLPNLEKVKNYLLKYPDMIDLLEPVCAAVLDRFPPPSQVALELYEDPEIDDQYLTIYVRQKQYDEDILDVLDEASRQFDDILCDTSGWLLVTTDFQDPL